MGEKKKTIMPPFFDVEPPSHGYEPRVIEGFFGPATLSGRGFFFKGRDAAALGEDPSVSPPQPNVLGGRVDLSAVARGPTHLKVTASATDASWADIKASKGWSDKPTDVIVTAEAGNADGKGNEDDHRKKKGADGAPTIDDDEKEELTLFPFPSSPKNTHTTDATTYLVGFDFGNCSPIARVSRPKKQKRIVSGAVASKALSALAGGDDSINSRALGGSATWFGRGNHVRLEGEAGLFGGRAVGWGTYTLNDEADQVNSTAINLVERERGFVISPFTAATAVAAAGVEAEFGGRGGGDASSSSSSSSGGRWKGAVAFDFNKFAPYLAVARETARVPGWLRTFAPPATSGKGLVGGAGRRARGDSDGDGDESDGGGGARIAVHLSPADRVAMLTLELGGGGKGGGRNGGGGLGGVAVGGGGNALSLPAPLKAFVRARTDGKGFVRGQGLRGVLAGLSGGVILNHTVEI